jgi:predicted nucleotidyltransferase
LADKSWIRANTHSGGLEYRPLFVTVSGAHLYGFPSQDNDVDLRGCHCLPLKKIIGLDAPRLTLEHKTELRGSEIELVSHDVGKYFKLLVHNNGYILEQVFSPIVIIGEGFLDELKPIANRCITKLHCHHYRGFYFTQRKLLEKEDRKRVKPLLYAYRVLMTGIYLMQSGRVEANLCRLNRYFGYEFLDALIELKVRGENVPPGESEWSFHDARLAELENAPEKAFVNSPLPENPDKRPVNELLVRLRLNADGTRFCFAGRSRKGRRSKEWVADSVAL